ncbi:MAG TPA: hypothetical protein VME92_01320 [Acetobacteraceae bacterium]|nr:hypothetical protein [Acetobacteraceae bacterium]
MQSPPLPFALDLEAADRAAFLRAEQAADALGRTLRLALALLEAGRTLDLTGLEGCAGRLCAGALDLPPEHGQRLRPRLQSLLAETAALEALLRRSAGTTPPD